ncbi:glycosyltransferase WbsX family protein [Anaeromyxobacter terrae]|uniref:glycosyltransferase WbsX family protein n=1 Tax=Anaeromyxobacter terrae TaxID=2925406 RepID=UPI001F59070E|nr:glycoside hydrolase family 99-like domain-containing protein [Anaeromyxobacter sp. SG22]
MNRYAPITLSAPKIIAFYLPQFHPIEENNAWWGPGFTEWHNVAKARPLFRDHRQPNLPGELGFYDLRLSQTRAEQVALAKQYGVHGFCYWHYWFGGKRLLETPLEAVLRSKEPDFPFCVGWANESWTGVWHGSPKRVLIEQTYPYRDAERHYALLRRFFVDPRYIKHEGKPLLFVYKPRHLPKERRYTDILRRLAHSDGYPGLYILGTWSPNLRGRFESTAEVGIDAAVITNITGRDSFSRVHWVDAVTAKMSRVLCVQRGPKRMPYAAAVGPMLPDLNRFAFPAYNCVIANWDNTPRSGRRGLVLTGSSPEAFRSALRIAFANLAARPRRPETGEFLFLKSWNEWAEGNYVEPDQVNRRGFLEAISGAFADMDLSP